VDQETERELAEVSAALKALRAHQAGSGGPDPFDEAVKKLPGKGELVKSAPAIAMICGTTVFLSIIAVFVTLTVVGKPTDELFRLMNLFLNATGAIGVLFTLGVAITHARKTMENRAIALRNSVDAHKAAEASAEASRASVEAARGVNGDLTRRLKATEVRIIEALRPMVQRAAEEAVRLQCEQIDTEGKGEPKGS
jgi:hypothetical protein